MSWKSTLEELPKLKHRYEYASKRSSDVLVKSEGTFHVAYYTESGEWILSSLKYVLREVEAWKEIS